MGHVIVKSLSTQGGGGGGSSVVNFSDTFLRADEPFLLGNDWVVTTNPESTGTGQVAALGINTNVVTGANFGGTGLSTGREMCLPLPVNWAAIRSLSSVSRQFSRITVVGTLAGTSCDVGPIVLANPNTGNCYWIQFQFQTGQCTLWRGIGVATFGGILSANFTTFTAGDIFELRSTPTSTTNEIEVLKNSVSVLTFSDNSGNRSLSGLYGIGYFGCNAAVIQLSNFVGGF